MSAYIRQLNIRDLDQCSVVESAAFPPAEAATYEKIEYRLSTCPELCYGLFFEKGLEGTPDLSNLEVRDSTGSDGDVLVAHVISTKGTSPVVRDQDMDYPKTWKSDPKGVADVGHQPSGTTIALHSLAVSPAHQRSGLGKALMKKYFEQMKELEGAESIAILTYDRLVPYYEKLGFKMLGKSASTYAGVAWNDLTYDVKN